MASDLNFFLSNLIKNQNKKKEYFICKKKKSIKTVLAFLESYGFILNYELCNNSYKVFLKNKKTFKAVKFFLKPILFNIKKKKLLFLIKKFPEALFVINSTSGIICQKKALKANIYGSLLFFIY